MLNGDIGILSSILFAGSFLVPAGHWWGLRPLLRDNPDNVRRPHQWPEGTQPSPGTRNNRAVFLVPNIPSLVGDSAAQRLRHIVITILLYYDVDYIQYELCTSFSTDA